MKLVRPYLNLHLVQNLDFSYRGLFTAGCDGTIKIFEVLLRITIGKQR